MKELEMNELEVAVFLALIKAENSNPKEIQNSLNKSNSEIIEISKALELKGMVIEINKNEFRALHPRFAVVNRYRKICEANNREFKKNLKIDQLAIMVEKYQNSP
jgi:sugar-specific transcriptional regulator TrmB